MKLTVPLFHQVFSCLVGLAVNNTCGELPEVGYPRIIELRVSNQRSDAFAKAP